MAFLDWLKKLFGGGSTEEQSQGDTSQAQSSEQGETTQEEETPQQ